MKNNIAPKNLTKNGNTSKWFFMIIIVAVVISLVFLFLLASLSVGGEDNVSPIEYERHVQIAVRDADEYFWQQFMEGAKAAGDKLKTYVEFVHVLPKDVADLQKTVDMAINAKVDGIAMQAVDIDKSFEIAKKAQAAGLGVVTFESGFYPLPGIPTIGSNYFATGLAAGEMAVQAAGEEARVLVVLKKSSQDSELRQQSTLLQGILHGSGGFAQMEEYVIDEGQFERNKFSSYFFDKEKNFDVIICLDEKSTPAIAQILVDEGSVGDVKMIGYGAMPQTIDYIKRGVIFGSVSPDAYETGYKTVDQLNSVLEGKQVSESINPKLYHININNVNSFITDNKEQ